MSMTIDLRTRPRYDLASVARMAGLRPSRARRWLKGYDYDHKGEKRHSVPVVALRGESHASFLDLVELHIARRLLDQGISLAKLRKALAEAKTETHDEHLFARRSLYLLKKEMFLEIRGSLLLHLLKDKQLAFPEIIKPIAKQIDFDPHGLAERWWPRGKEGGIVVDPSRSFGTPILARRGIPTATLYDLYLGEGSKFSAVARWMKVPLVQVKAAVDYEAALQQAA